MKGWENHTQTQTHLWWMIQMAYAMCIVCTNTNSIEKKKKNKKPQTPKVSC